MRIPLSVIMPEVCLKTKPRKLLRKVGRLWQCQGNNFGGTSFRRWWGAWRRSCLENGGHTKSGSLEGFNFCLNWTYPDHFLWFQISIDWLIVLCFEPSHDYILEVNWPYQWASKKNRIKAKGPIFTLFPTKSKQKQLSKCLGWIPSSWDLIKFTQAIATCHSYVPFFPKLASSLARQVREYRFGSPCGAEGKDDQLALEGSDFDGSAL